MNPMLSAGTSDIGREGGRRVILSVQDSLINVKDLI